MGVSRLRRLFPVKFCPDGFKQVIYNCYKMILDLKSSNDARNYCSSIGAKLAEPRTNVDLRGVRAYLKNRYSQERPIIGGHDTRVSNPGGSWVWLSDNSSIAYLNWTHIQTKTCLQIESMLQKQVLNAVSCSLPFSFLCEAF
ncbi:snaclec salmorin subunit A-like [Tubulanus polymorphus]|uniref:snaclec salmorin subunit A-like n=1 Tax=Tubulanus polymorphus TaxID=672921 RepID=UPI003DA642DA